MRPNREIYADHAATTPPAPEVVEAMRPFLGAAFGNASSVHRRGEAAREAIETARGQVADLVGAAPEEVVFTASGSEANNLALQGVLASASSPRARLVVSAIEHPSVLETARHLASRGVPLTIVPVDRDGLVDPDRLEAALGPDVHLVSVMWVNNETGVVQPIEAIGERVRRAGARFHIDAVQAVGKVPVRFADLPCDLLSLAGHKFYGPLGAAALIARRRTRLVPLVHGGHQERSRRAGTENLPAIVGLGAAAELAMTRLESGRHEAEALGGRLLERLESEVDGVRLNGHRERRISSVLNVAFEGVDGEAMLHELDLAGITVSTGSACSAASAGPSHVLLAMGRTPEEAHASVRYSLGEGLEEADVETIVRETRSAIARLSKLNQPAPRSA
ncbi:MAG TPA: cysteine desulfurase family protein [Candidatus Eisenbacteria bacterium]|nr:cysteine desulfurase family protein [Candidatus Eisenbacteria bacterium]